MAFSALTGSGGGGAFVNPDEWHPIDHAEKVRTNFNDHESRIITLEAGKLLAATRTLTNNEIKALPTTPITVVNAPGAGKFLQLISVSLTARITGAYTNIDPDWCGMALALGVAGGGRSSGYLANDSTTTPALGQMDAFLGAVGNKLAGMGLYAESVPVSGASGYVLYDYPTGPAGTDDVEDFPLVLGVDNNGSGDFTGGNVANSLKVTVYYLPITF